MKYGSTKGKLGLSEHPMQLGTPYAMVSERCGAKTRTGEPCQAYGMANGRCRMHGGSSLAGPASATFKTGRYSKILPARLAERYQEAQADNELLALRDEVSLLDARLSMLLEDIDSGNSANVWKELQSTYYEMEKAVAGGNKTKVKELNFELSRLIRQGGSEYQAWSEVYELLERRRKLVESERKRLVEMQQMITSTQAMAMMAVITDTIRKHVTDRSALAAIAADLRKLSIIDAS